MYVHLSSVCAAGENTVNHWANQREGHGHVMSDPPPKTSEVLTGSSMQIKIPNGNIWAKKLGKTYGQNEILSETRYYRSCPEKFRFVSFRRNYAADHPASLAGLGDVQQPQLPVVH